jgi:hypothetical protein
MAAILLRTWVVTALFWVGLCFFKMRGQHILGDPFTPDEFIAAAALPPIILLAIGAALVYALRLLLGRVRPSRSQLG